jgi:hypothetical protein
MQLLAPRFHRGIDAVRSTAAPIHSSFFAGYATFLTGASSVTTTFRVPKPTPTTCGANSGIAPGSFIFAGPTSSETLDAAGMLDQCSNGAVTITPALVVSGFETNFTNVVRVGDTIEADVSVGGGGTSVTLKDLTAPRTFTLTQTGGDTSPDTEVIGTDTTTINGFGVPVGPVGATKFTASKVGGSAIGTQSPTQVILASACQVLLLPGAIDKATGTIFSVAVPTIDITNLLPASGKTGTNVEIDGYGFNAGSTVKFGAVSASTVTHDSATVLHAVVPNTAVTGPVSVKNTTAPVGSITSACTFSVTPTITSFTPQSGTTGSTVTINGSGLKPGAQVKFGTRVAKVTSATATQLKATVPDGAVAAPITVKTPAGSAATATNFTPTLSITSFNPTSGPFGTVVLINGLGFNSTSAVKFNGVAATTVVHTSATQMKATVPSTASTGPITVTNGAPPIGTVRSATSYTVTPHTAPTVTSFNPTSGPVGTPVTITGTFFSGASAVKFGTVKATYKIVSATQITTKVPTGAVTGPISVTTAAGTGTSGSSFTVT